MSTDSIQISAPTEIVGFDPGGTTGFAHLLVAPGDPHVIQILDIGEFPHWTRVGELIQPRRHIVYEKYAALSMDVEAIPYEVVGVIRYLATRDSSITLFGQTPGQRYFASRRWPTFLTGYHKHHKDALMHALTYLYHQLNIRGNNIHYLRK